MFNDDKYIAVSELLLKRGRMQPLEAMLYQRCYRFFLNCQKEGKDFYVDQLEAAQLFRVTRKTLRGWLANLEQLGLLVRTGSTPTGNITYIVKDFTHVKGVLMGDDEYLELCKKYKREREANREQLQNHIEQRKADDALEPVSLCKPSEAPEQVQDESTYQEQETTPQEAVQEPLETIPVNGWPVEAVKRWHLATFNEPVTQSYLESYRFAVKPEHMKEFL